MFLSDSELLAAIVALAAGYFVYNNVMNQSGSRKAAFWWAFAATMLPIVFVPAYIIFRIYTHFKQKNKA